MSPISDFWQDQALPCSTGIREFSEILLTTDFYMAFTGPWILQNSSIFWMVWEFWNTPILRNTTFLLLKSSPPTWGCRRIVRTKTKRHIFPPMEATSASQHRQRYANAARSLRRSWKGKLPQGLVDHKWLVFLGSETILFLRGQKRGSLIFSHSFILWYPMSIFINIPNKPHQAPSMFII